MKRAKHTLSYYRMLTGSMGELMPVGYQHVLPGDTFQCSTDVLIRVTPLNTPVMHPVRVRVHHFFVPYRILWPATENGGWEEFITGGKDGLNNQSPPRIDIPGGSGKKALSTYFGLPPSNATRSITAFPIRAYNAIYNEYYRDQDIIPERQQDEFTLARIAWEKDRYGIARPWTQKGPEVTLPIAGQADIQSNTAEGTGNNFSVKDSSGNQKFIDTGSAFAFLSTSPGASDATKLYADLATAQQVSINDFRAGFALQRYQEARARYGSRFTEYLRYLGITPSDARLQRPEFLAGGSTRLSFSEVLQTTPNSEANVAGVGDLYGHGIAGVRSNNFRKFFEEHGIIVSLLSVRPKAMYLNGIDRQNLKITKEDYFQRELANLGQQEIQTRELHVDSGGSDIFGYEDRYQEYRTGTPSQVTQDFRDTLNAWHLGRELASDVALNKTFTECQPSDRIYQVNEATADPLWIMANHKVVARRMVPKRANPRVL